MADRVGVYDVVAVVASTPGPRSLSVTRTYQLANPEQELTSSIRTVYVSSSQRNMPMSSYTRVTGVVLPLTSSSGWGYGDWTQMLRSYTYRTGDPIGRSPFYITGSGHGDVIGEFSSTHHEVRVRNAYLSGTERFESGSNLPFYFSSLEYGSWAERFIYLDKRLSPYLVAKIFTDPSRSEKDVDVSASYSPTRAFDSRCGKTQGITGDQNYPANSYAVLTFLTGALGAASGSNPAWYLGSTEFDQFSHPSGSPLLPDSSMSLGTGSAVDIDASASLEILRIALGLSPSIPGSNIMEAYLTRQGYTTTAVDAAQNVLNSGTTPGL